MSQYCTYETPFLLQIDSLEMSYVGPTNRTFGQISVFQISQSDTTGFTGICVSTGLEDKSSFFQVVT